MNGSPSAPVDLVPGIGPWLAGLLGSRSIRGRGGYARNRLKLVGPRREVRRKAGFELVWGAGGAGVILFLGPPRDTAGYRQFGKHKNHLCDKRMPPGAAMLPVNSNMATRIGIKKRNSAASARKNGNVYCGRRSKPSGSEIVATNDLTDTKDPAHLVQVTDSNWEPCVADVSSRDRWPIRVARAPTLAFRRSPVKKKTPGRTADWGQAQWAQFKNKATKISGHRIHRPVSRMP